MIRQLGAGLYCHLPLARRVQARIERIVREEMDAIGAQEFLLPAIHPAEIWRESGRWDAVGPALFRLRDRKQAELALAMTAEEVFTGIARADVHSYRQLPQIWYQITPKFRDEPRPKSGVLRGRQFTMKDSYSFDLDQQGLDWAFESHAAAYRRIFARCGLEAIAVEASSGIMGGGESIEFVAFSDAGEDRIVTCAGCGYAANLEKASAQPSPVEDRDDAEPPESFPTPGLRTIEELARAVEFAAPERQIKTLATMVGGELMLFCLRGDHELNEVKQVDALGATDVRPAEPEEALAIRKALEIAHIFKLGLRYSEAMGARVLTPEGREVPVVMGSYGIGIDRIMAGVVETHHDEHGIVWPTSIAPFDVVITPVVVKDEKQMQAAEQLYTQLQGAGLDVLLDDRDERAGVKFKDADLIGIPFRLVSGPRALANGNVELVTRSANLREEVALEGALSELQRRIQ
jgi:prolyl-tRNA synthetase